MSDDHSQSEFEKLVRSREELQYIAGVLDSEGSIMLLRYMADIPWRIRPRITITNIDRHLLERCRRSWVLVVSNGSINASPRS